MPDPTLFLIDANALCYRSYFAIKNLSTSSGQATNAVYGFTNTLRKILRDYQPDYMAVCFDVGKKTRRQQRFAEYKIHRPSMPDDLVGQLPLIKEVVAAHNLPIFELEGFEADDVIATITRKVARHNIQVVIVSGDKDMTQLLNDKVKMFNVRKGTLVDYRAAEKELGIDPKKITDYIGLAGDKTDNIPGVNGIGDVTARALLDEFGSLEKIFAQVARVSSPAVREKLIAQKDAAFLSKELAILDDKVPIDYSLDTLEVDAPDNQRLTDLYRKLEFRKFADELAQSQTGAQYTVTTKVLKTVDEITVLCNQAKKQGMCAFLCDGSNEDDMLLFDTFVISLGKKESFVIASDAVGAFKEIFENAAITKITHNVKDAMKVLCRKNITLAGDVFDVMLAGYLLAPQSSYDIATLSWTHLRVSAPSHEDIGINAYTVFQLYAVLQKELEEKSLTQLFTDIEIPLAYVLFRMETDGVKIDTALLARLSKDTQKTIAALVKRLYTLAGMEFNLNSPKQLSHVLFEKLKLPVIKKTKTGFSTDEGVLVKLAQHHALPAVILEYRQLAKLKSTYIDALPKLIDRKTKRLHASFNQTGTETGRLSSSRPNLQNIPIRTDAGREIRKAFIAAGGTNSIISADYSQIELRILAHLSGDKNLITAFKDNQDIHRYTAAQICDVKEKDVTRQMRTTAKRVNFGIIYGMSAFGLAKDLVISQAEAQDFIDRYFLRYPGVKRFMDAQIEKAQKDGFVTTLLNRRRYLPDITSPNMGLRQFSQRQAINTPVQGSAADFIKLAMINVQKEIEKRSLKSRMIITVHDELVFDVLEKERTVMVDLIREHMEHPLELAVPITVSIKTGKNWLELREV